MLVRGGAEVLGLEGILVRNSLGHFCAVLVLTACMALVLDALRPIRPNPKGRAWRELDRGALVHNAQVLQDALAPGVPAHGSGEGGRLWPRGGTCGPVPPKSRG